MDLSKILPFLNLKDCVLLYIVLDHASENPKMPDELAVESDNLTIEVMSVGMKEFGENAWHLEYDKHI